MARQTIDVTTVQPNGQRGEPAKTAFEKTNANFSELYGVTAGLGTAATKNAQTNSTDTTFNALMAVGAFGLGGAAPLVTDLNALNGAGSGVYSFGSGAVGAPVSSGVVLHLQRTTSSSAIQLIGRYSSTTGLFYRQYTNTAWDAAVEIWTSGNTTVDSNGFVKRASPIIKLYADRIEKTDCPENTAAAFERIAMGHYLLTGTTGLSAKGWYIETPKDANGNIKVFVEYEDNNGAITIRTYAPDYSTGRATAGAPADIPDGRWIDIRCNEVPDMHPAPPGDDLELEQD